MTEVVPISTTERCLDLLDGQDQVAISIFEISMEQSLRDGKRHSMDYVTPWQLIGGLDRLSPKQLVQLVAYIEAREYTMLVLAPSWMNTKPYTTTTRLVWEPERMVFRVK
ncbi:MAG: hypothetical protein WAV04_03955 [Candidatus Microsaccharimonas sp.]|jgi:hypothetical protein